MTRGFYILFLFFLGIFLLLLLFEGRLEAAEDAGQTSVAIEALNRLEGIDLEKNPAVKKAVLRILEKTRGTPDFVHIVKKFNFKDQNDGLLKVALNNSTNEAGNEAANLILKNDGKEIIQRTLQGTNASDVCSLIQALSSTGNKNVPALLEPLLQSRQSDPAVQKKVVRALAQSNDGALLLLKLAKENKLSGHLRFIAASELNTVMWPAIKKEAAEVLPLPAGIDAQPLPPLAALLKLNGDVKGGAAVFKRDHIGCIKCHKVKGDGVDLGPDLTEIGSKLGKDALYESILDPNAGISFGYEAHRVELKSGDEIFGLVVSDTPEDLGIKDLNGIVHRLKKSEVSQREGMKQSMMPSGLQQAMTAQDLVDLVEFLFSLKKAGH